jgi:hypothetical protein
MRTQIALATTLGLLLAGCAPGANEELRGLVEEAKPANAQMIECNWGTNWGDSSGSYYSCVYLVPGGVRRVGQEVLEDIAERGFIVTCRVTRREIELLGARGETMVYAGVVASGSEPGSNVSLSLPRGQVLVEVAAFEDDAGVQPGRLCTTPTR